MTLRPSSALAAPKASRCSAGAPGTGGTAPLSSKPLVPPVHGQESAECELALHVTQIHHCHLVVDLLRHWAAQSAPHGAPLPAKASFSQARSLIWRLMHEL